MKQLTEHAKRHLDGYLRSLRGYLRGSPSVDVSEVERDVLGHIERELETCREPVEWTRMQVVLDRLGHPIQWVREEELPLRQRLLLHLRSGPEDWRLAYLAFAMAIGTALLATAGSWAAAGVLGVAAFIAARASLSVQEAFGDASTPQRSLLAPILVPVSLAFGLALLILPLIPMLWSATEILRLEAMKPDRFPTRGVIVAERLAAITRHPMDLGQTLVALLKAGPWIPGTLAVWWTMLAFALRLVPGAFAWFLRPRHARLGALSNGLALAAVGALLVAGTLFLVKHVTFNGLHV